ncbi:MlaD family protein [Ferrimonas sp. YFM]|uniref:MlaD family protein n=1 Tax=Ferrimonas sp. YFM TaxID=3028878 RepID=UPI0025747221|nr:MlaD family protein [Ferrimonas sp. YFM]BDY05049.1 multivalent adhesion molecule 7 [Ferrimonas sp. YFM]
MNNNQSARVRRKRLLSPIWILPILATVLGAWLLFTYVKQQGTEITIRFPDANGIEARKTLVKYQGLVVGMVQEVSLNSDRLSVNVTVKMDHTVDDLLRVQTRFWLVSPKASLTGVEGLDALFSGNYIAMKPGEGERLVRFEADIMAPTSEEDSTLIQLIADKGGSLDAGSGVYFQQIKVGSILQSRLDPQSKKVQVTAQIDANYAPLVKESSHFWNVSGLSANASLGGVKLELESIASLLTGGVAFDSPEASPQAKSGSSFRLYENREAATQDHFVDFDAASAEGLKVGSKIRLLGVDVGELTDIRVNGNRVSLTGAIRDSYRHILVSGTRFWQVKGQLSLRGVRNLGNLVLGDFINVSVGSGAPQDAFLLEASKPDEARQGQAVTLHRRDAAGLSEGSPVHYNQLQVGEVLSLGLDQQDRISVRIWLNAPYDALLGGDSQFWLTQGVRVQADLSTLTLEADPLPQLISGGIAFSKGTPDSQARKEGYPLLDRPGSDEAPEPLWLRLTADEADGLAPGAPVYYRQLEVGQVEKVRLADEGFQISLTLDGDYARLFSNASRFWRYSGLRIHGSLTNFEVDTAAAMALLRGGIAFDNLEGLEQPQRDRWLYANRDDALTPALRIQITLDADADLQPGAPVKYHQQSLGKVERVSLNGELSTLTATLALDPKWADRFAVEGTRYYLAEAELGFGGTKNLSNLVLGNHLAALPGPAGAQAQTRFTALASEPAPDARAQALRLVLTQPQLGSVRIGSPVLYRQIPVGKVVKQGLAGDATQVEITIELEPEYRHLVNRSSRFWNASGLTVKLGLFSGAEIHTESLDTLLMGGIAFATQQSTNDENRASTLDRFPLHESSRESWLEWKPVF